MDRGDTKVRKLLADPTASKSDKYRALIIGRRSLRALVTYEFVMLSCSWVPGVLGLFLRSKLYPLILGRVGRGTVFGTNVVVRHGHKIQLGDGVIVDDNCLLDAKGSDNQGIFIGSRVFIGRNTILSCKDGDIHIEDGVNIGFNSEVFSSNRVVVGKNTMIAGYTYLVGGGNYDLDRKDTSFAEQDGLGSRGGIVVGPSAWIGAGATIMDGVTVGSGSVIGAGSVVLSDIPADSIAAGVPARILRSR